ncbi:hypothetical protein E2562_024024 [Oryza meyeriana var. granulata]|uniref:Uncharacterized protein n=1 Tax=Oryza meyeriana var. granulata TaxID=110450 RepID=A0A6G1CSC1_9ORYZ|nr:hypothetical protein E2562_024024 [Oryza meyeriana var. granulata]
MKGRCRCSVTEGCDRERSGSHSKVTAAVRTTKDPAETGPLSSLSPPSSSVPRHARTVEHHLVHHIVEIWR